MPWGAIIGAGLSAAAALAGNAMRNEAQKRESELAYQRERQQIKEQNAYNSASAQMARLQAAGLNPNMMYEQSQEASAGMQTDIPRYQPAEQTNAFGEIGSVSKEVIDSMIGISEMQNKIALTQSELVLNEAYTAAEWAKCDLDYATMTETLAMLGYKLDNLDADTELKKWQSKYSEEDIKRIAADTQRIAADTALLAKKLEVSEAEIRNLDMQTRCQLALLPSQIRLNEMSAEERMYAAQYAWGMYNLAYDEFDFEKGDKLEWQTEQNKKDRTLGYFNGAVGLLGIAANVVTKMPLGQFVAPSPLSGSSSGVYGSGRSTFGSPSNHPGRFTPANGSYRHRK